MSKTDQAQAIARTQRNKARRQAKHMQQVREKAAHKAAQPLVQAPIRAKKPKLVSVPRIATVMRQAFDNIMMRNIKLDKPGVRELAGNILEDLRHNSGTWPEGKGWNAHLSFRTAKLLGMPTCENPYARMAYDNMVKG